MQATELRLVHRKLTAIPAELAAESDLKRLDLSDNPLQQLQLQHLPANLQELVLAGCHLHGAVPSNLNQLTALEQLVLSANSITSADAVFSFPQLVHVGLAYNHLSTLISTSPAAADAREGRARCHSSSTTAGNLIRTSITTASKAGSISYAVPAAHGAPASAAYASRKTSSAATTSSISGIKACSNPGVLASCNIMSLDLSHNHITDLPLILQQLQQLPKLRALHLQGNPISLLPHYKASVLQQLPLLIYLDGQKLDDLRALPAAAPAAKPSTAPAAAGGHAGAPTQGQPAAGAAAATAAVPSADAAAVNATSAGASASSTAAQAAGPNSVTITLELYDLRVLEPAAAVFQALTDKAVAQLQQQLSKQQEQRDQQQQQQQEQQGSCNPSRPTTSSGARTESTVGAAGMPGSARQTSSSGSCPNTARSQGGGTGAAGGIIARVSVSGASIGSSSGGGGNAGQAQPPVPLQPLRYHLEVVGPDGSAMCSTAVVVSPSLPPAAPGEGPAAAAASSVEAAKGPGAKGGKQAEATARPGSSMKPAGAKGAAGAAALQQQAAAEAAAAAAAALAIPAGQLRVQLSLPADVATRDWLRTGFDVLLRRTCFQPQPVLPPVPDPQPAGQADATQAAATSAAAAQASAAAPPAAGSKSGSGHGATKGSSGAAQHGSKVQSNSGAAAHTPGREVTPGPQVTWEQQMQQEDLGTARVKAPAVVEGRGSAGQPVEAAGAVSFCPPAPLLHPVSRIRLALTEAQQLQQQVPGTCAFKITLH